MPRQHAANSYRIFPLAAVVALLLLGATAASAQDAPSAPMAPFAVPSAYVEITDSTLLPSVITVTVGAEVFWTNATGEEVRLTVQEGRRLYLPLIQAEGAQAAGESSAAPAAQPEAVSWTSDPIAPGGRVSHIFTEAGEYALYASHLPGQVGTVYVLSDTLAATVLVHAQTGGVVEAGGSRLDIPPGALAQDTAIVVSEPISGMTMAADGMRVTSLEPSGLQLNGPALLTISYGDTGSYDEDLMQVTAFNAARGEWEPQAIVAHDTAANTVSVQVELFSSRIAYIDAPLYVVMEIPGKYLKPGSVLVRMDGNYPNCNGQADWFPGHTAIFSHATGSDARVIEANVGGEFKWSCLAKGDVHLRTLDEFITESCGFYMGAMYKEGASDAQMNSAVTEAQGQLGKGYYLVGQGNWQTNCFSCVGLVEYAYDKVGASIIPDNLQGEGLFITPLQQYRQLRPVNEITVKVGDQIRIPVHGINLVDVVLPYYERTSLYPTASPLPSGSSYSGGVFAWTPQAVDGGKSYLIQFKLEQFVAGKQRIVTQILKINVQAQSPTAEEVLIPAGSFDMGCYRFKPADTCYTGKQPHA